MLSFRHALQHWPRTLRFFVFVLAMVQFVAPTWHICELSGHARCASPTAMQHMVTSAASGPRQSLICYCAPRLTHRSGEATLSPTASNADHPTCLALLLQTLPGHFASTPALFASGDVVVTLYTTRRQFPVTASISRYRGRAPPVSL